MGSGFKPRSQTHARDDILAVECAQLVAPSTTATVHRHVCRGGRGRQQLLKEQPRGASRVRGVCSVRRIARCTCGTSGPWVCFKGNTCAVGVAIVGAFTNVGGRVRGHILTRAAEAGQELQRCRRRGHGSLAKCAVGKEEDGDGRDGWLRQNHRSERAELLSAAGWWAAWTTL